MLPATVNDADPFSKALLTLLGLVTTVGVAAPYLITTIPLPPLFAADPLLVTAPPPPPVLLVPDPPAPPPNVAVPAISEPPDKFPLPAPPPAIDKPIKEIPDPPFPPFLEDGKVGVPPAPPPPPPDLIQLFETPLLNPFAPELPYEIHPDVAPSGSLWEEVAPV